MISFKEQPDTEEALSQRLHPLVKAWFFSRFPSFSLPQLFGVSEIHGRKNILVCAPTGATKTLTSFLAILNELVDASLQGILQKKVYAVYASPLKALNEDIKINLLQPLAEIEKMAGKQLGIRVGVRTGDTTAAQKSAMLKAPPHILITTPESLSIVLASLRFKESLQQVDWLIVDEIHSLAENKRGAHLSLSMERLQRWSPGMARIGLSATVAPLEEIAKFLVGPERDCVIVNVQFLKPMDLKVISPVPNLIDTTHDSMHQEMYTLLHQLVQEHKTTLIFTNTRSATERVVHYLKDKFPKSYHDANIGAHHGSLSKDHRFSLEDNLRKGNLKAVVCSTSLELGIDIGYIDLVILLGSPKSVARALQRIGRSGHQLHATTKGRIIVLDRDDLVECSVLLKLAVEKKIDTIHIPTNCLDVLVQHIHGLALEGDVTMDNMLALFRKSYCYAALEKKDLLQLVEYLAGKFISLEDRSIYAKIWYDEKTGMIGKRGRMSRVIHMTNIGTIPDQTGVKVKVGDRVIGVIEEAFLERLKPRDVFVLGGNTYEFRFSRGMTVQVDASVTRSPTVPSWFSEMLPLSFDLAMEIGKFRRLLSERFAAGQPKKEILEFINSYLYVDENAANAIYEYVKEQYDYVGLIPSDKTLVLEHYIDEHGNKYIVAHALFGRRVNDCLSRALGYAISKTQHHDVEIGVTDNGFYLHCPQKVQALRALKLLKASEFSSILQNAIDRSEVLRRRFRHCAGRALMILRSYGGRVKRVGRQQVSSQILMNAVKRISPDFFILREARREVLEDLMDIANAKRVIQMIENDAIKLKEINTTVPSPFAFNLVLMGHVDILKMEDRVEFLKRMHEHVMAKIALGRRG
ncbi:ATP-dependent helicase [Candidatus Woesearchaeota archaeon]|nr:ATP-dependent helicase [Candidatus Woesearchaeota archaeon]